MIYSWQKIKQLSILDWKKFSRNRTVLILLSIFGLLAPLVILFGRDIFKDFPAPFPRPEIFYEFPTVWDYQGYISNWLVPFLLGFLVIFVITSEVSNRTMRQNIITGLTRQEFFISKLLTVLFLSLAATILYSLSTIIIGMIHTDGYDLELIMDNNWAILKYFLMCLGYMSFAMLLAYLIRRGTLTILIYFFYVLMLEPILMLIHVYYFTNASRNYWPMNCIEDLHPNPLLSIPSFFTNKEWNFPLILSSTQAIGMTIFYTLSFIGLSYWLFNKRDI